MYVDNSWRWNGVGDRRNGAWKGGKVFEIDSTLISAQLSDTSFSRILVN